MDPADPELEDCASEVCHPVRRPGAIVSTKRMSIWVSFGDRNPLCSSRKGKRPFTQKLSQSRSKDRIVGIMIGSVLLFLGIIAGFFLPGFLLNRLLGKGNDIGASFIISLVVLFQIIFITGILGFNINLVSVGMVLILISILLYACCRWKRMALSLPSGNVENPFSRFETIALVPVALAFVLIFLKSSLFPVPEGDQSFRWFFLAFRIFEQGSFSYYPSLTPADFSMYFSIDSFPPIVSFSYFWLYALYGKAENFLACVPVTIQFILIFIYGYMLSKLLTNSKTAGFYALLLLGASTLFFYSVAICQETGMTALSLVATVYYLVKSRDESKGDIIIAAFAASAGALSRDYGGIFVAYGLIVILWHRYSMRTLVLYLAVCTLLVAPWYLRTFILTGNPFYSNTVGDLFPVNPVHVGMINAHEDFLGLKTYMTTKVIWPLFSGLSIALTLPFFAGVASGLIFFRRYGYVLVISAIMFGLWLSHIIIPAGIFHSMRILSPAISLLAVCGACGIVLLQERYPGIYKPSVIFLSVACLITCFQNIFTAYNPFNYELKYWPMAASIVPAYDASQEIFDYIEGIPDGSKILTDDARYHSTLARSQENMRNISLINVCSPEVRFLFDKDTSFESGTSRLKKLGINYVIIRQEKNINYAYLKKFEFFRKYKALSKSLKDGEMRELP